MKNSIASFAMAAAFAAMLGATQPAHAGFLTFVSDSGNDANDCLSSATACRQIEGADGALAKTDNGGVIHVLQGEYVAFAVVGKSVDIIADGGQASVVDTIVGPIPNINGNAGIGIAVGSGDVVRIRGFILNPDNGIAIGGAGGIVHLENNTFIGVSNRYGIAYQPSEASELYVKDTTVARENGATGGGGILIKPVGSGSAKVILDNVSIDDNSRGIFIDGRSTTGGIAVAIRDSTISGSTTQGVWTVGANVTARVHATAITGNGRGLLAQTGSRLISVGGNMVSGNTIDGAFTATEAQK